MGRMYRLIAGLVTVCACCAGCATTATISSGPAFIAGTTPDRRPEQAPVITAAPPLKMSDALHGITSPYPDSIEAMLNDQGAWYTPFTRPGMTGRYDIRGYH